jgi:hypothetical protein
MVIPLGYNNIHMIKTAPARSFLLSTGEVYFMFQFHFIHPWEKKFTPSAVHQT